MMGYLGHAPMTVAALALALPSAEGAQAGGPPQFAFAHVVMTHSPAEVAPILGATPEELVAALSAKGFAVASPHEALTEIAATSGKTEIELVQALLPSAS